MNEDLEEKARRKEGNKLMRIGIVIEGFEGFGLSDIEQKQLVSMSYWLGLFDRDYIIG